MGALSKLSFAVGPRTRTTTGSTTARPALWITIRMGAEKAHPSSSRRLPPSRRSRRRISSWS